MAYQAAPHETLHLVAARAPLAADIDNALEGVAAAYGDSTAAEEAPPKFELAAGFVSIRMGDKLAGFDTPTTVAIPIAWDQAFQHTFGLEAQIVLRRPPRPLSSLEAGDTFLLLKVTSDTFEGQVVDLGGGATSTFSNMSVTGGWIDGKTVFNPMDKSGHVRPYLQYGGGMASMDGVIRTDSSGGTNICWAPTVALGFHMGVGLEMRIGGALGIYMEAGIQNIRKPNLDAGADAEKQAQDLLTYPLRIGVMFAF